MVTKTISQALAKKSNDYSILERNYQKISRNSLCFNLNNSPSFIQKQTISATVVIPAWNAGSSILSCLTAIEYSSFNIKYQNRLQVVVVDDGSTDNTWQIIKNTPFNLHLTAVKQPNLGQSKALNTGISIAEGDIIISCDADMVLNSVAIEHFIIRHQLLPNVLLVGFRSDVKKRELQIDPAYVRRNGSHLDNYFTGDERISFSTPGLPNNMCLASGHFKCLGNAKGLWMPGDDTSKDPWRLSDLVFGALFSLRRDVYIRLGGYDERLNGWGCADGLLASKAISNDQYVIPVYSASGLHITTPFQTQYKHREYTENRRKYYEIIQSELNNKKPEWIKHAKKRIKKSATQNPRSKPKIHNKRKRVLTINHSDNLLAIGNYSEAYNFLNKIKSPDSNNDKALRLGEALIGMNKFKESIKILEEVSKDTDFALESTLELIIAQSATGNFIKAHALLTDIIKTHPEIRKSLYWYQVPVQKNIMQGRKYLDQKFYDIALRCFEVALIADPGNRTALKYRIKCINKI